MSAPEPLEEDTIREAIHYVPWDGLRGLLYVLLSKIGTAEGLTENEGAILELALEETLSRVSGAASSH